jgi:hypothetical protein
VEGCKAQELQVQLKDIYDSQPDHRVYEYFRDLFSEPGQKMDDELGAWMQFERKIKVVEDIMKVPVQMSMLVVAMDTDGGKCVPNITLPESKSHNSNKKSCKQINIAYS